MKSRPKAASTLLFQSEAVVGFEVHHQLITILNAGFVSRIAVVRVNWILSGGNSAENIVPQVHQAFTRHSYAIMCYLTHFKHNLPMHLPSNTGKLKSKFCILVTLTVRQSVCKCSHLVQSSERTNILSLGGYTW